MLLGITLDEVLFLLEAAEKLGSIDAAIAEQAPLGTATALTTAAGFGALVICKFPGLVDVGKVGALGSTVGAVRRGRCDPRLLPTDSRYINSGWLWLKARC